MKIKLLIMLLAFVSLQAYAQTKPCQLPRKFVAHLHDWLTVEDSDCTVFSKMTIADFLSTLGVNFDSSGITGDWLKADASVIGGTVFSQTFMNGVSLPIIYDNGSGLEIRDNSGVGINVKAGAAIAVIDTATGDTLKVGSGIRGKTSSNIDWKGKSGNDSSYIDITPQETKIITKKGVYTTQLRNKQYGFSWSFGRSGHSASLGGDSLGFSLGYQNGSRVALFGFDDSHTYLYDDLFIKTLSSDTVSVGGGSTYISNQTSFGVKCPVVQFSPLANGGNVIVGATNTGAVFPATNLYADTLYYTKSQVDGLLSSGTYTPTVVDDLNITSTTLYQCQWMRVGNVVTVSGMIGLNITAGGHTETQLHLSLPINSAISANENAGGTIVNYSDGDVGQAFGSTPNVIQFNIKPASSGSTSWTFHYTYLVIP